MPAGSEVHRAAAPSAVMPITSTAVPTSGSNPRYSWSKVAGESEMKTVRTDSGPIRLTMPRPAATTTPAARPAASPATSADTVDNDTSSPATTRGRTATQPPSADGRKIRTWSIVSPVPMIDRSDSRSIMPTSVRNHTTRPAMAPTRTASLIVSPCIRPSPPRPCP